MKQASGLRVLYPAASHADLVHRLKEKQSNRGFPQSIFGSGTASTPLATEEPGTPQTTPTVPPPTLPPSIRQDSALSEEPSLLDQSLSEEPPLPPSAEILPTDSPVIPIPPPPSPQTTTTIPESIPNLFDSALQQLKANPNQRIVELRSDQLLQADRDVVLMFFDLAAEELRDPKIRLRRMEALQSEERTLSSSTIATQLARVNQATELPGLSLRGSHAPRSTAPTPDPSQSTRILRESFIQATAMGRAAQFGAALIDLLVTSSIALAIVMYSTLRQQPDLLVLGALPHHLLVASGIEAGLTLLAVLLAYPFFCALFLRTVGLWTLQASLQTEHGSRPSLEHLLVWALLWPSALLSSLLLLSRERPAAHRLSRTVIAVSE